MLDPFSPFDNELDALLAAEMKANPPKQPRVRNAAGDVPRFTERLRDTLGDRPENWKARRAIALMHTETQSLLGCYLEYTHTKLHTEAHPCTKLVRVSEPVEVQAQEWVSGDRWIVWKDEKLEAARWAETTPHVVDLYLSEIGVRALTAPVMITCAHGGIMRVDLAENTQFHSDDAKVAIALPKGLNVLDGLGLDCKLAIRAEVGL